MDIGKSFTYMFDDEEWVAKLVIGALLMLASIIPVVNLFTLLVITGYTLRVLQNVASGSERPLPEWNEWGSDWVKGLMVVLASLIYAIPSMLASGMGAGIEALIAENGDGAGFCIAGASCLSGLWGLVIAVVFPAALILYAKTEEFGAFFRFGEMWALVKENLGDYVIAILLGVVAQFVAGFGVIACIIGVFFTAFWSTLVSSHLLGQVAFQAGAAPAFAAAAPAPVAPAEPTIASYSELESVDYTLEPEPTVEEEEEDTSDPNEPIDF